MTALPIKRSLKTAAVTLMTLAVGIAAADAKQRKQVVSSPAVAAKSVVAPQPWSPLQVALDKQIHIAFRASCIAAASQIPGLQAAIDDRENVSISVNNEERGTIWADSPATLYGLNNDEKSRVLYASDTCKAAA